MSKKTQNCLLVKSGLGTVREGCYSLPPSDHTYGKQLRKDKYGVRQVLWNWIETQRSSPKQGGKDYITMNRQGIKHGFIDSKQLSYFHKNNEIKVKVKEGQKIYGLKIPDEQFTYGIPNRPSTPIKNVICNSYAVQQLNLKHERQAVLSMLDRDKKKSLPKMGGFSPRSKLLDELNRKKRIQENNFKLSKFMNVPSKIKPMIDAHKAKMQIETQHGNNINNKGENKIGMDANNTVNKK